MRSWGRWGVATQLMAVELPTWLVNEGQLPSWGGWRVGASPGKRVHSEPTRRPIVRSAALKGAEAERWLQRSLLRSTIQWTRAWPSLLLAGGKRAPFSRRPSLTPESTTERHQRVGRRDQGASATTEGAGSASGAQPFPLANRARCSDAADWQCNPAGAGRGFI